MVIKSANIVHSGFFFVFDGWSNLNLKSTLSISYYKSF